MKADVGDYRKFRKKIYRQFFQILYTLKAASD